jgi:hypothetical protein
MKESIKEYIENKHPEEEIIICEGFDEQFLGIGKQFNKSFAIYNKTGCIEQIAKNESNNI